MDITVGGVLNVEVKVEGQQQVFEYNETDEKGPETFSA